MTELGIDVGHVTVLVSTPRAFLVRFEDGEESWIPRSELDDENTLFARGSKGVLVVPRWLAEKLERVTRVGYPTTPAAEEKERSRRKKTAKRA